MGIVIVAIVGDAKMQELVLPQLSHAKILQPEVAFLGWRKSAWYHGGHEITRHAFENGP